jgi:predicted DNA-binding transcriptional regulator YafY
MSRTERLFDLLNELRARRLPVTAAELARDLGVSPRSVYRDIDTLRSLGAPVEGQAGIGYYLGRGFFLPELAFSADELDALLLGLEWVRQRADPALARRSESARAKILAAREQTAAVHGDLPALLAATARETVDPPQAAAIRAAIHRQRKMEILYEDAVGNRTTRTLWPIAIVYFEEVRLLAAWCEARSAFRHFRLDRVHRAAMLEARYPGRRQTLFKQWRAQDRDWRSMLTVSDTPRG